MTCDYLLLAGVMDKYSLPPNGVQAQLSAHFLLTNINHCRVCDKNISLFIIAAGYHLVSDYTYLS